MREPLVGGDVLDVAQAGRGDLSDWVVAGAATGAQ
jgi:hypothetical protein